MRLRRFAAGDGEGKGGLWKYDGLSLPRKPLLPYDVLGKLAMLYGVTTDYLLGVERERFISVKGLSEANIALVSDLVKALKSR